jgi:AcrR family transcriptional regulator
MAIPGGGPVATRPRSKSKTLSRRELYDLVWAKPMTAAAQQVGLSPNGLAKICDRMLIPYPTRGHWTKAREEQPPRPALPKAAKLDQDVTIAADRAASRRVRTRLSPDARREQMLDAAMRLVADEGMGAASMKRVAREIGVSEALAFTYFNSRAAMLAELARRELAAIEQFRRDRAAGAESRRSRVELATAAYLEQIEARGSVLHVLLAAPEVRALLRPERRSSQRQRGAITASAFSQQYGVPSDLAYGATQALTAASRRAGHVLATKRVSRTAAERLVMAMINRSNRDLVAASASVSSRPRRRASRAES